MQEFFQNLITGIGVKDFIDVAIIAFVIYKILGFIRETRAEQLVKGILIIIIATVVSWLLQLYALNWILRGVLQFGIIALVVVFQPELRRGLEYLGRAKFIRPQFAMLDKQRVKEMTTSVVKAIDRFSSTKCGALIVIEREISLTDFAKKGVLLNSELNAELLETIFYPGSPMHDGAVIIRGDTVLAAAVIVNLTENRELARDLGTRHRAGIGITEVSDALAIMVSEETGIISMALGGKIKRFINVKTLEKTILDLFLTSPVGSKENTLKATMFGRKHVSK